MNFENCKFVNLSPAKESVLYVCTYGGDKLCSYYPNLINHLHNLKAVTRAVR